MPPQLPSSQPLSQLLIRPPQDPEQGAERQDQEHAGRMEIGQSFGIEHGQKLAVRPETHCRQMANQTLASDSGFR